MSCNVTPNCLWRFFLVLSAALVLGWNGNARAAAPAAYNQYWWYPEKAPSPLPENWHGRSPVLHDDARLSWLNVMSIRSFFAAGPIYSRGTTASNILNPLLCIGCSISDPNFAIDNDPNTAALYNMEVGLISEMGQRIVFPGTYEAGDSLVVDFALTTTGLVDASVLNNVRVRTYLGSGNTAKQDVRLGSALNVQLLGVGSTGKRRAVIPITSQFDQVAITFGGLISLSYDMQLFQAAAVVPVTIAPADDPIVSPAGQAATMTASHRLGAATFRWYDAPTGGTLLNTGATYAPVLTRGVHDYYVEATTTADGLTSILRTGVTVDVGGGPGLLWSYGDQQESPKLGGICALCSVTDPGNAIDADPATFSTISSPVGVASTVGQLIKFPGIYQSGDSIILDLELPGVLYTKSILTNISLQPYLGAAAAGPSISLGTDLIQVQALGVGLGGTPKFRVSVPASASFDGVQVNLNAVLAELATLRVYEAVAMIPVAVSPAAPVVPYGTSASLAATVRPAGATFNWYTTPTGGSPVSTSATFNTPDLTRSTTYYVEAVANGITSYTRTAVPVRVGGSDGPLWTYGDTETSPVLSGVCVGCSVSNPQLAVDQDTTTASTINIAAGVLSNAGQLIRFPGNYHAGDSIILDLGIPAGQLLSLQLLSGIRVETFNGSTANNDAAAFNTSLANAFALGIGVGPTGKFRVSLPVNTDFDAVQISLAPLIGGLANLQVYEATATIPVAVNPAMQTVPYGTSATITAANRLATATFNWYTTPTGGSPVFTGATFNTPNLTAKARYYVEAATPDGKKSFTRTLATVNLGGGAGPLWSYGFEEESPKLGGVCLLCSVSDPGNAVDGNPTTFSTLSSPVGVASTVGQLIKFPGIYQSGDSIILDLELPGVLYTKSILTNISLQPYLGAATAGPAMNLGTDLIHVQALGIGLGGTPKFRVSMPVTTSFDAVQVNLNAVLAELATLRVYEAVAMIPVSVTPNPAVVPYGTSASLSATVRPAGATFNWYTAPTGGSPVGTGATFNSPNLTRSTTYYVEATADGVTSYVRTAVPVRVGGADGPLWSYGDNETSPVLSGICLGCTVNNPELAVDEDTTTASTITIPLGVLSNAGQLIRFPGNYHPGDSIILDLGIPAGQLLSLNLLNSIRIETFNGTTSNNDAAAFSTALANAQVLGIPVGATGKFRVTLPAGADFDAVQISLAPVVGGLSNLQVFEATAMVPLTVAPSVQTVPLNTSATIGATIRLGDATVNWYTTPTGGSPVGTGASFNTPNLTRQTFYWAEASTPDGKKSFVRTMATVNVGGGPGPLWTYGDQQAGPVIGGVCVGCSITDPAKAVDEDTTTSSLLSMPLGALGSISQVIHFPGVYQAGDSIALFLELPDQLFSLSALGGLTAQTYLNNVPNGDVIALNNSLVRLEPLGLGVGSTGKFRVTFPVGTNFDGVSIGTTALLAGLNGLRVYEAVAFMPLTITPPAPVIASGATATMTASVRAPGATYSWFTEPKGGTAVGNAAAFTTPVLTRTKQYFAEAFTPADGKRSFSRTAATVTVNGGPGPLWTYGDLQQSPLIGGICLGCGVSNPNNAVDQDTTTASQITMTVGALGSVGQLIKFPGTYQAGDSIALFLGVPNQLVNAQLLSGIRVETYSGDTPNGNPVTLDNDLADLQLLGLDVTGDVAKFKVVIPATTGFDGVRVDLNGVVAALGSLNVYEAAAFVPVTVAPPNATVPFGNTQTFNASIRFPGATFSWYETPTGGVPVATTATFTTPTLLKDKTYYVQAATPDGLTSFIRTSVPVTVTVGPASPDLSCGRGATSTATGTVGLCLLCGVDDAALAVDANPETASSLHLPVGLLGGSVYQRISFPTASTPGDSLRVVVGSTTGLLDLNLLAGTTVRPRIGTTENTADVKTLNSGLLNLQLLNGGTRSVISFVPTAAFDNVEIRLTGVVSALNEINVFYVQQITARPTIAADTVNVCSGQTATLNATVPAGNTVRWYSTATGGTPLATGASFVTPAISANTVYYAEAVSGTTNCPSETRVPVVVQVGLAEVTVTANSVTIPQGSTATFTVNSPNPALTYQWYDVPVGGTAIFTGPSFTTPALQSTTTYYVEATNATGCASAQRVAVVANVTITNPDVPCDVATTQVSSVNGICIGCFVDNQAAAVDASANSASSLHVVAGLLGAYAQQTLIFPSSSDAGDSVRILISFPSSLADVALLGGTQVATYNGTTFNNDRVAINNSLVNLRLLAGNTQAVIAFKPNAVFDRVEVRLNSGVATLISALNIHYAQRLIAVPDVTPDTVTTCAGGTATFNVAPKPNTLFRWYTTPAGGTPIATGTSFTTGPVSVDSVFYVEAVKTSTNCANPVRTKAFVKMGAAPAAPTVESTTVTTCEGTTATLRATGPAGATFNWYTSATGGTSVFTGADFTTPVLDSSVIYYVEGISAGGCASAARTAVQVNVTERPAVPDVTPASAAVCVGGNASLSATSTTAGVDFKWYSDAGLTNLVFTGPVFNTPAITSNTTYYVVAASGQCVSTTARTVNVLVEAPPAAPIVSINPASGTVEYGQTATLTISTPQAGATYNWYLQPTGGSPVHTGNSFTTPQLSNATTFYAETVSAGGCASSTRTAVTVNVNRDFNPGCDFANQATSSINGICLLCAVNNPDNAVDNDTTNFANISIPVGVAGDVTYNLNFPSLAAAGDTVKLRFATPSGLLDATALGRIEITSFNGNTSNNDTRALNSGLLRVELLGGANQQVVLFKPTGAYNRIQLRVRSLVGALMNVNVYYANRVLAAPTITASDSTICAGSTTVLTAVASDSATVRWYTQATGGTPVFTGKVFTTPALSATTTYYAESFRASTNCPNPARTAFTVNVLQIPPSPAIIAGDTTICAGNNAVLKARPSDPSLTIRWFAAASGGTPLSLDSVFTTPALSANTTYYVEAYNGTCGSATRTSVTVTVSTAPPAPVLEADSVGICAGANATLRVTAPAAGVVYRWYTTLTGGTPVFEGATFTTPALNGTTIYYVEAIRSAGGCPNAGGRVSATVTVGTTPAAPTVENTTVATCAGTSATLRATAPAGATFRWYTQQSGGTPVFTGATYITAALNSSVSYYVEAVSAGGCASATRTAVQVNVSERPAVPDVTPGNATVCIGSSAVLSATSTTPGVDFKWYSDASLTNLVFTGAVFTTPALGANATYYVVAVSGQCTSATPRTVTVMAEALPASPAVTIVPASGMINYGQTAILTITTPNAAHTYRWYTQASGGTAFHTGTSFTTPQLANTTVYYVEALTAGGCASANRTAVTINVNRDFNPGCDFANAATSSINGICVLCAVNNPDNAVDNDTTNFANISIPVGVAGDVTYNLNFPGLAAAGDTVKLRFATPGGLLDATALGRIEITSFNGATSNGDTRALNSSLLRVEVLGGANQQVVLFSPGAPYTSVQIRVRSLVGALMNMNVYYANRVLASPTIATNNVTICAGTSTTLTATASDSATVRWYTQATGGRPVFVGKVFNTPVLNTTTTYYAEAYRASTDCANPIRTQATVNVLPVPPAPAIIAGDTTICIGNNAVLKARPANPAHTIRWFATATGGTALSLDSVFTTPNLTANTTYYAEAYNGTCGTATRVPVTVTVATLPPAPVLVADSISICTGATGTLSVQNPVAGVVYRWYNVISGGTPIFTGNSFVTPALTNTTIYYVEAIRSAGGCPNAGGRVAATVNVNLAPAIPVVTNATTAVCLGKTATVSVSNPQAGITYRWYAAPTGGAPIFTGAVFNTPAITDTISYFVDAVGISGCTSPARAKVHVTVNALPPAPTVLATSLTVCLGGRDTLRVLNPTAGITYNWYDQPGGTLLSTGANFPIGPVNAADSFYVQAVNASGCGSAALTRVTVAVAANPVAPVVAGSTSICPGDTVRLSIQNPAAGVTYRWFNAPAGGNLLGTGSTFTATGVTSNVTYYAEALNTGGCVSTSRTAVLVTVNPAPPVVTVDAASKSICIGTTATLNVMNPQANLTYRWYDAATGGNLVGTGASFTTPVLNANRNFYVQAVNSSNCVSASRTQVSVTVTPRPGTPTVTNGEVTVCAGNRPTASVSNPVAGITYRWYDAPIGGTLLFTGNSYTTATPLTMRDTIYVEAVNAGDCASGNRAQVILIATAAPAQPVVVGGTTVCAGDTVRLSIQTPQAGITYSWYSTATGGTPLATGTSFTVNAISASTSFYVEANNGTCASTGRTVVAITVNPVPGSVTVDATAKTACAGSTAVLNVTNPQANLTYRWFNAANGGTLLGSGTSFSTPVLTGNTSFYVEAVNTSNCASNNRTQVMVTVSPAPATPTVTAGTVTVCAGNRPNASVSNPVAGITYRWYDAPSGGTLLFTGANYTSATPLTMRDTIYVEAVNTSSCASTNRAQVILIAAAGPAVPVIVGNTNVCAGAPISLSVQSPQAGITYRWYDAANGGSLLFTGSTYAPTGITATTSFYVESDNGTCASATRAAVTVTISPAPPVVTVDAAAKTVCAGNMATINVTNPQAGLTYRWYDAATGGTLLGTGTSFTTPAMTANDIFYVEAVNAGNCASSMRTSVNVTVTAGPDVPLVVEGEVIVCRGDRATGRVRNARTDYQYRWYDAPSGGNLLFTGASYTTPAGLTAKDTVYVEASLLGGSCASNGRAQVIFIPADAPSVPVLANGGTVNICSGATATFTIQNPVANVTYRWYDAATGGTLLQSGTMASYTTGALTSSLTVYVEAVVGGSCTSAGRATARAEVGGIPVVPVVTADANTICPDSTVDIRATSTQAGTTFTWFTSATGGTPIFTGPVFTTPALTAATTYYVAASNASGCVSATRTPVTINVYAVLPAPTVSISDKTATSVTFSWNAIAGALGYRVSTDGGATFTQPSSGLLGTTHTVTGLQPNQTVTLQVMTVGASECQNSAWFQGGGSTDNPAGNLVFVPNAFTPNNDGTNDILYVYGTTIRQMEFRVYNQWGQLVFESRDRGRGWDGTMSGRKQPVGVYNYVLRAVLQDGTVVNKRGTITIVR
ncbi:Ig-like domain-containing protein [Chitinophaga rhizosphaerae]|uniref:Ig-like domain-containing protein n=1 Tax=Chitinophaga rhizosphaerae TaxID=1864947 RepID=UPI000F807B81|nr:gliding motility-associated C-terminal domain-containing protein [Chitinophaga rhizosphaerae]